MARAAGPGRIRFADFLKPYAGAIALVLQHSLGCAPANVQHQLALAAFRQSLRAFMLPTKIVRSPSQV